MRRGLPSLIYRWWILTESQIYNINYAWRNSSYIHGGNLSEIIWLDKKNFYICAAPPDYNSNICWWILVKQHFNLAEHFNLAQHWNKLQLILSRFFSRIEIAWILDDTDVQCMKCGFSFKNEIVLICSDIK